MANVLGTFPLIRRVFLVIIDSSENNAPSRLHLGTITKNIRRIVPHSLLFSYPFLLLSQCTHCRSIQPGSRRGSRKSMSFPMHSIPFPMHSLKRLRVISYFILYYALVLQSFHRGCSILTIRFFLIFYRYTPNGQNGFQEPYAPV